MEKEKIQLQIAKKLKISIQNPRCFKGGIRINIYIDERLIASGYNDARGGGMDINPIGQTKENRETLLNIEKVIAKKPQYVDEHGRKWHHTLEDILTTLVKEKYGF